MRSVVVGTKNAGKLAEIVRLCQAPEFSLLANRIRWQNLTDYPAIAESDEPGRTFLENARHKALYYAAQTGAWTLADDSGLEVDLLQGLPGVQSAYFAGRPRDDKANNSYLCRQLKGVAPALCTARYRCVLILAKPGEVLAEASGTCEGRVILEGRGTGGFGYDPHFFIPELDRTMAELSPEEKNAISHRGKALQALLAKLSDVLDRA